MSPCTPDPVHCHHGVTANECTHCHYLRMEDIYEVLLKRMIERETPQGTTEDS